MIIALSVALMLTYVRLEQVEPGRIVVLNVDPIERIPNKPTAKDYEAALLVAAHHFADVNDDRMLYAILDKHPSLLNRAADYSVTGLKPKGDSTYHLVHRAAERGHLHVLRLLVALKADLNAKASSGWTPLHLAAKYGQLEAARFLVEHGADPRARTTPLPEREAPGGMNGAPPLLLRAEPALTPLDVARQAKHQKVVDYLTTKLK